MDNRIECQIVINSPLGFILIESKDSYILRVEFIGSSTIQSSDVHGEIAAQCARELNEYFDGKRTVFTVPHRQEGTEFQQKVWRQLEKIDYGNTMSYLDLALSLGDKNLVRAVGTANGKNKIAILVPCHRVIGSGGALVGYAGELWRKHWLLEHEKSIVGNDSQLSFL